MTASNQQPKDDATAHVSPPELGARLAAALLRELAREHARISASYFRGRLRLPNLTLGTSDSFLGRWIAATRTLELSRALIVKEPWPVTVEILKHEMAHQFVDEVLGIADETAHGPTFAKVCADLGIDARAKGLPTPARDSAESQVGERIAKLLALAESPNAHEAEAAMLAAQKLLLKHNLEWNEVRAQRGYGVRHLGKPKGRTFEPERVLATILMRFFFVDAIWIPVYRPVEGLRGSVLEICGAPGNLDIAEYVHGFLTDTAERLWREHKRSAGLLSDRDRRSFIAGVMSGVHDKLSRQERGSVEAGLVWVGDAGLSDFMKKRHPHVRHVRYGGEPKGKSFAEGRTRGRSVVIHKGIQSGPSAHESGRGPLLLKR